MLFIEITELTISKLIKRIITKVTKQSNMAVMLKDKGIKESVEPLRRIVVEKEGGKR